MVGSFSLERRHVGVALAAVVFVAAWAFLSHSFYAHKGSSDAIFYQPYGLQMHAGKVPYRDFGVEYPPGALPVFLAPTYVGHPSDLANYERWFTRLMCVLGLAMLLLVARARPPAWGLAFVAISPLLSGRLAPDRFDLWPTALTTVAVVAFLRDRHRLGWAALAAAFAAKIYPVALVLPAAIWTFRRRGFAELLRGIAIALAVVVAIFGPFLLTAPHEVWASVWGQASRPMQLESLAASYLMTIGHPTPVFAYQTFGIEGHGALLAISLGAQIGTVLSLSIAFARGEATDERFIRYAAASVCAFIAFGKVFSPQYLIWLIPLVALVRGRRGMIATAMLVVAFVATNMWYGTHRFDDYIATGQYAWLLLGRNILMVLLVALLAAPALAARRHGSPEP